MISVEENRAWSSFLCSLLHSPVTLINYNYIAEIQTFKSVLNELEQPRTLRNSTLRLRDESRTYLSYSSPKLQSWVPDCRSTYVNAQVTQ
jgi:hypothetical protein